MDRLEELRAKKAALEALLEKKRKREEEAIQRERIGEFDIDQEWIEWEKNVCSDSVAENRTSSGPDFKYSIREHDLPSTFKVPQMLGANCFWHSDGKTKKSVVRLRNGKREVKLTIRSWVGISSDAVHVYGKFHFYGADFVDPDEPNRYTSTSATPDVTRSMEIELTRQVNKKDFKLYPDKWTARDMGQYTHCFNTTEELIEHAQQRFEQWFGEGWVLEIDDNS